MTSFLLAGPAQEPVSLGQAKLHLRVEDDAEDGLIAALVSAARIHLEAAIGRALLHQSWCVVLDRWPEDRVIRLPVSPLVEIGEIRVFDADDEEHQVDLAQFLPDGQAVPARIICPERVEGVPPARARLGIEIDYVAGMAAELEDVPADLTQALLVLVAYWYENRDAVSAAGGAVPAGFERLVSPYRRVRL